MRPPFERALHPAGSRRRRRRAGRGLWADNMLLGQAAQLPHGSCLLGQGLHRRRDAAASCTKTTFRTSASRTTTSCSTCAVDRLQQRQRDWLVPGTLRVGSARAGQSQHHRRSAQSRDEGHRQHQDQVPRALSAVRAVGAGGVRGELLRSAQRDGSLPGALHALRGAGEAASTASILPAITHVDGTGRLQTVFKDDRARVTTG